MEKYKKRRSTSVRQLELLIQFMEDHSDLAFGRLRSKELRAHAGRMWEQCATVLNAKGAVRSGREWSKVWNDYKSRVRGKLVAINKDFSHTSDGPSVAPQLTPLEDRVAVLLSKNVDPLTTVQRDSVIISSSPINEDMVIEEVEIQNGSIIQQHDSPTLFSSIVIDCAANSHISPHYSTDRKITFDAPEMPPTNGRESEPATQNMPNPGNTEPLDKACAIIARIEEMRARADVRLAEAAATQSAALQSLADSVRIIALSFQGYINVLQRNN